MPKPYPKEFRDDVVAVARKGATGLNDNTWHHVVGTMSSSTGLRLYVDGVQVAVDTGGTSARAYNGQWRVAWDDFIRRFPLQTERQCRPLPRRSRPCS